MARTGRDTNLEKSAARARLAPRGKPYWQVLESGLHLGYRRTKTGGGSWTARRFLGEHKYAERGLGFADDLQVADGVTVLTFSDAQGKARDWWKAAQRAELGLAPADGPYTVAMALDAYFNDRERRGSKGVPKDRAAARSRISPALGNVELPKLTTKRIRDWHTGLATAPKLVRTSRIVKKVRKTHAIDTKDADGRAGKPVQQLSQHCGLSSLRRFRAESRFDHRPNRETSFEIRARCSQARQAKGQLARRKRSAGRYARPKRRIRPRHTGA